MGQLPVAEIQCAAAVGQPAHNQFVFADHLLAVDAEVLPFFFRPAGDYQWPGNQWPRIIGPAGLNGQFAQIHLVAFNNHSLTGRFFHHFGGHIQNGFKLMALVP